MTDEVFELVGPEGQTRRGILTLPDGGPPQAALLLLTAGVKYRTGPGQLYVAIARRLAELGFATLRFDPLCVGESDGSLEAAPSHELWLSAERGRFVADAALAYEALERHLGGLTPVFLGGLCGGGLTAQMPAAALPQRPAGLISINIAARETPIPGRPLAVVASESRATLRSYPRKLVSAAAWKRVFTGTTSVRTLATTVAAILRLKHAPKLDESLNPRFVASLRRTRALQIPHLLIFSGTDSRWFHFNDLVLGPLFQGEMKGPAHEVRVVPDAEHHLFMPEWRDAAVGWIAEWMRRR